MPNPSRCNIDGKSFELQRSGDSITVQEWGNNFYFKAQMSLDLARWILSQLKALKPNVNDGFSGSKKEGEMVISISVRSNTFGQYASVLFISKTARRSNMSLCIPKSKGAAGWSKFSEAMEMILPQPKPSYVPPMMGLEEMGGVDRLIDRNGYDQQTTNLESTVVMAIFSNFSYPWTYLVGDLESMFKFSKLPTIYPVGGNSYIVKCDTSEDAKHILTASFMILDGTKVTFKSWNPNLGTIHTSKSKEKWIELIGLPTFMMTRAVANEICSKFGVIKKTQVPDGVPNGVTCMQVLLSNLDIFRIPHFLAVANNGISYTVRISMAIVELYPMKSSHPKSLRVIAGREEAVQPTQQPTPIPAVTAAPSPSFTDLHHSPPQPLAPSINPRPDISPDSNPPPLNQPLTSVSRDPRPCCPSTINSQTLSTDLPRPCASNPSLPLQPSQIVTHEAGDEDDGLVSDSGDESSHCAENLEEQEENVQGEDVVNFITKKLVELNEILDLTAANNKMREPLTTEKERRLGTTSRVEQDEDRELTNKKMNDKKVRKMATRSARRRKRGALYLQAEELHLEST